LQRVDQPLDARVVTGLHAGERKEAAHDVAQVVGPLVVARFARRLPDNPPFTWPAAATT
jgi:hypothetical protein